MTSEKIRDKTGGVVVYMDSLRRPHLAIVTDDFNKTGTGAINLAYVNDDPNMRDPYGQQLLRFTSIGFWGDGSYRDLMANCWMYVGDYTNIVSECHGKETKAKINGRINEATSPLF